MEMITMLTIVGIIIIALIIYSTALVLKQIDSVQESLYLQKDKIDSITKDVDIIKYVITTGNEDDNNS